MSNIKEFPTLYKRTSTGKVQLWTIKVDGDKYWTESGQQGGKIRVNRPTTAKAKNVGRSNETTPEEQALKEAKSKWDLKLKGDYFEDISMIDSIDFKVMKGKPHEGQCYKLEGKAVMGSYKLDGVRCYINKDGAFSKNHEKFVTTKFIEKDLEPFFEEFPDAILDGELYNHKYKDNFNEIIRLVNKKVDITPEEWKTVKQDLQFHIYDVPKIGELGFEDPAIDRYYLGKMNLNEGDRIKIVDQKLFVNYIPFSDEHKAFYDKAIALGYEGIMVKLQNSPYEMKRTANIQKFKEFITEEFKILDIIEGKGNRKDMFGKFVLELPNGGTFKANARGDEQFYRELWEKREEYIGKQVTHRFMNYTPDGVPRGGAVIAVRDYE